MAWSAKPVDEQSKLASVTRSLIASSTCNSSQQIINFEVASRIAGHNAQCQLPR